MKRAELLPIYALILLLATAILAQDHVHTKRIRALEARIEDLRARLPIPACDGLGRDTPTPQGKER